MEKTTAIGAGGGDASLILPEDSFIQILVRLPAVSLLRFKSVCTSWCALIKTSFFIDLHSTFNSSSSSSNFGTFILRTETHTNEDVILMLSEYEGSEYVDGYRFTDGSWHEFTGGDGVSDSDSDSDSEEDVCDDYMLGFKDNDDDQEEVFKADDDDADHEEVFKADDDDQLLLKVDKLELPSGYKLTYKFIAGSCNGLICLYDFKLGVVSLWNPATRQFRTLPKPITIEIDDDLFQCGMEDFVTFGFDVKTKDYKVLLIPSFRSKTSFQWPSNCQVLVYSLSTDSWRLLEGINNSPLALSAFGHHGLYLNGSCFFLATNVYHPESNTYNTCINSFDFTKEIFTTMQIPDHDRSLRRQHLFLRCLGGEKMALFTTLLRMTSFDEYDSDCSKDADGYEDCDIYEHSGCGVNKESWTKLHSFQIKNTNKRGEPLGISNNGKFAFLDIRERSYAKNVRLYNLVTKEVKLDIPLSVSMSKAYVYKPSLVSISSPAIV